MPEPFKLTRIPSLKTVAAFRDHLRSLGLSLPCDDAVLRREESPLAQPLATTINGKTIGNRVCVHPMEGWDGTPTGEPTADTARRWQRFGESGAKLIFGGEAMAVRPDGRANPRQLMLLEPNAAAIQGLVETLRTAHQARFGRTDDLVIGFQLTHSGRFCRPVKGFEPRVAFRHPLLDQRFNVTRDDQIFTDDDLAQLVKEYVAAARIAWKAGADFVDIKHCHGYLLHEILGGCTRPGRYGGSFANRTRMLREIAAGIRADGNPIEFGVRVSAFDFVPFRPDPALSSPGKPGPGIPEDFSGCLPYRYAFGCNQQNPVEPDLEETFQFVELCAQLGVKILNVTAGSPYYNPHIQRPAAYPPSDGYQPAHDPLIDVARQIHVTRQIKARAPKEMIIVGTAYSYLQEFVPHVAQAVVRDGWVDSVGLGRAILSYPAMLADAMDQGSIQPRFICRTFSDCTTAPRNGMISGCYPLDGHYSGKPEAVRLKEIKKPTAA